MKLPVLLASVLLATCASAQNSAPAAAPSPAQAPPATAQPSIDPAKQGDIAKLLEVSGAADVQRQMIGEMEKTTRPLLTQSLPPGDYRDPLIELFFAKFKAKADLSALNALAIPVYDKYFTDDEIKGLIAYYSTPLGKKTLSVLPKVLTELTENGTKWGESLGRDSMVEVLAEHPELKKALEDASKGTAP